jgi:transposase
VLIDHTNARVLDVLETRDKSAVVAWLAAGRDSGLLAHLEEVTIDMWDGYATATREALGSRVRIVVDRFHVMKHFQDRLEKARREIQHTLPKEAASALKGSRWLWITNAEHLSIEQRQHLDRLKAQFPALALLAEHRDQLRQIFQEPHIKATSAGVFCLSDWCRRGRRLGIAALQPFYKMLESWMTEIANYFVSRSSNGRTEGFNRGLRTILWRTCGMTNFNHFRLRVLNAFG